MTTNTAPLTDFDDTDDLNGRTARGWEELARSFEQDSRADHQRSSDSFDRCDTDGFLSQWASDCTGRLNTSRAAWARDHGYCRVNVLVDVRTGRVVSTREKQGQFGDYWVLDDAATDVYGKRFFSESRASTWAKKAAAHARKGFAVAAAMMPANQPQLQGTSAISVSPASRPDWYRKDELHVVDYDLFTTLSEMWDNENAAADDMREGRAVLVEAEPVTTDVARKGSHAECTHDNTKAARAKCRRTR